MIIGSVTRFKSSNVEDYSWSRIAQFHNIPHATRAIIGLHRLPKSQEANARKQAEQLKFCLVQAREYFKAAAAVTLATRPVLLYYGVMCLALAEVLLKQSGDSRLQKLRSDHPCHGLTLSVTQEPRVEETYDLASSRLVAKPQFGADKLPKGTFEVWRKSAREYPIGGMTQQQLQTGGAIEGFSILMTPTEDAPHPLASNGMSLKACIANLPYMGDVLARWNSRLEMVRGRVSGDIPFGQLGIFLNIVIQQSPPDLLDRFGSLCKSDPTLVNFIDITEFPNGYAIRLHPTTDGINRLTLPHATAIDTQDTYFSCSNENLSEFGYIYIALHILGNFARYYPDVWMKHLEAHSPLANVSDELCKYAFSRLPLLTLSELTRTYMVLEK